MDRHAYLNQRFLVPLLGAKRALGEEGGLDGVRGRGERRAEGVTDCLEDEASVGLDDGAQDLVVAGEGGLHGGWVALPETG
jgi:hypothetical protein